MTAPISDWFHLGVLIGADGLFGLAYGLRVWRNMIRHGFHQKIDHEDRAWYALLPIAGHCALVTSGALFLGARGIGCEVLAGALGLLMLASIRNAWDMTVFWTTRSGN
jgi:hypothetical protein